MRSHDLRRTVAVVGSDIELLRARARSVEGQARGGERAANELERRLNQARDLMIQARNSIERDFPITRDEPLKPDPFGPFPPEDESGTTRVSPTSAS